MPMELAPFASGPETNQACTKSMGLDTQGPAALKSPSSSVKAICRSVPLKRGMQDTRPPWAFLLTWGPSVENPCPVVNAFRQARGSSWPLASALAHFSDILLSSLHSPR